MSEQSSDTSEFCIIAACERFSFYGINYTQTAFMTGVYDAHWNAGFSAVTASSYGSISVAVAYTTPFLGAFFADQLFGDYWSILVGSIAFYLPGIFLIALTTIPGALGDHFNRSALLFGLLIVWPLGTGSLKSVVNVFGAKQFHPLVQSSLIEGWFSSVHRSDCRCCFALPALLSRPMCLKNISQRIMSSFI